MGICSSCLGFGRRSSSSDPSDTSQLLADQYQPHYGGVHGSGPHTGLQPDPEEIRRQRDALERICAQASDKLIDVSRSAYTEEGSKMTSDYPRLFKERFSNPQQHFATQPSASFGSASETDQTAWLVDAMSNQQDGEPAWDRVIPVGSGALTLQFDEVLNLDKKAGAIAR